MLMHCAGCGEPAEVEERFVEAVQTAARAEHARQFPGEPYPENPPVSFFCAECAPKEKPVSEAHAALERMANRARKAAMN